MPAIPSPTAAPQRLKKSLVERIAHAVLFEVIALALCAPLFSWLMGTSLFEMGALTLAISLLAMVWNVAVTIHIKSKANCKLI